jgi:DNA-binding FadR family transcriptional regulator
VNDCGHRTKRAEHEGDHRDLVAAIEDRDAAAAAEVMCRYLHRIRTVLFGAET